MKNKALGLSLLVNVVFVCALIMLAHHPAQKKLSANHLNPPAAPIEKINSIALAEPPADKTQWIQQSQAAGVPNQLLAQLVATGFEKKWSERKRNFDQRYWLGYETDASRLQFEQQHDAELEQTLRTTLGDAAFVEWDKKKVLAGFDLDKLNLSAADENALYQLQKDWNTKHRELELQKQSGQMDDATYEQKLDAAGATFDQQRQALLGDERYTAMLQAPDSSRVDLRRKLGSTQLSDAEFDSLVRANQDFQSRQTEAANQLSSGQMNQEAYDAQIQTLEAAKQQAYEKVLGVDGYADFQKRQDSHYEALKAYATAAQLSTSDVDYLYRIVHDYEKTAQDYRRRAQLVSEQGQDVDWQGVQQNLQQYTQQTEQALRAYLGNDRFTQLKQNNVLELNN